MGNVLAPLGQICCQTNAQLILIAYSYPCFQDSANACHSCCLNSSHLTITFIWRLLTPDNSFHQQTIQTIDWQSPGSQLSDCQDITAKTRWSDSFSRFWVLCHLRWIGVRFPLAENHQVLFRKRECHRHSQIYEHPQINPKNTGLRKKISEKVKSVSSVKSVFKFLSIAAGV